MVTVVQKNLENAMRRSNTDIGQLNDATRANMYDSLIGNGLLTEDDVKDVALLLRCSPEYLMGKELEKDIAHNYNTLRVYGDRIRERMDTLNWSIMSLSNYTGIPYKSINAYRNKNINYMSVQTIQTLAFGLGCSVEYLTKESDDHKSFTKYRIANRYRNGICLMSVDMSKLRSYINRYNVSIDDLSKKICCPTYFIRYRLEKKPGKFPTYSAKKINDIFSRIDIEKDVKAMKEQYKKEAVAASEPSVDAPISISVPPSKDLDQQEAYAMIRKFGGEVGKSETHETLKDKAEESRVKKFGGEICKSESPEVTKKVVSTTKISELLELVAKVAELNDDDYNEIVRHLKWAISKSKNESGERR